MVAFAQTHTPIFTVLMRRSFGVAGNNYATPRRRNNARVVWPSADVGGIPPEGGIEARTSDNSPKPRIPLRSAPNWKPVSKALADPSDLSTGSRWRR